MTMKNRLIGVFFVVLFGCESNQVVDQIPSPNFGEFIINVNAPQYFELSTKGFVLLPEGVRGIILYKNPLSAEYIAYERNCSYQPASSCAVVEVDNTGLLMVDACCKSEFALLDGVPRSGPAVLPLRQYVTQLNGSFLTISPQIK